MTELVTQKPPIKTFATGLRLALFLAAIGMFLPGQGGMAESELTRVQYLMGTLCEIRAAGASKDELQNAITGAFEEIARLEQVMSTFQNASEISLINQKHPLQPVEISRDLMAIVKLSLDHSRRTRGAFDVTFKPLEEFWRGIRDHVETSSAALAQARSRVGWSHVVLDETRGALCFSRPGMSIDFGGIGKGYALDQAAALLMTSGMTSATLNFGGQVLVAGHSPEAGAVVRISDPTSSEKTLYSLRIRQGSVSTSSQHERFRETRGKKIGHIIDPRSGEPVPFVGSVTVVAPTAAEADALSTALLVLGPKEGIRILEENYTDCAALFLVRQGAGWKRIGSKNISEYLFKS